MQRFLRTSILSRTLLRRNPVGKRALSGEKLTIRDTDPNRLDKMEFYLRSISNDTARKLEVVREIRSDIGVYGSITVGCLSAIWLTMIFTKK